MSETPILRIAVVGAGIAGLTAAIALKNHPGIDVQIYERATKLTEIGASIALGPNGLRTLDRLGLDNAIDGSIAFRNLKTKLPMIYRHYKTNEVVSADNHKGQVEDRHLTSRYYRAHLQQALLEHVDPAQLHLGKAFLSVAYSKSPKELTIKFLDGSTTTADLLLGADGINSAVRRFFVPSSQPKWTGWVTFRSVFPFSHVSHIPDLPDEATHFWGHDRTLFVSNLGKDLFTVVGSYQSDPDAAESPYRDAVWDSDGDVSVLREYYKDWSPLIRAIVDAVPHTRIYPNVAAQGLDSWTLGYGRVTLAGDAAHAHGGAFAAGGSLAIDDGWSFAQSVLNVFPPSATKLPGDEDIAKALRVYGRTRKPHTDRVLHTVHSGNKAKVERIGKVETDEELRARMKNRGDPTWIHEHDVVAALRDALAADKKTSGIEARL
ncbi:FAD/NAD(P)-binding domain-containing protein [Mytilinidion resinicola]|uniref:FAD/NAD(P)-binding domain-containing protein n=1 Tax=Mytilinidion resinicola TaxID=574789 RepID=A0A6A6XYG4_9PEZI|nr:FAD/NAD(P)-binding domain-containing protein [Mytilinidion resinicola]KAF2801303.1 FAD/NAD(P)-binding domain-containing protein [Mytilinidion resinicola]